ncbi:MAG TPA: cupin domain-containing protein [Rhizobacter sp.]|nr:cupin domain-containing protein [Rhizobacter sp.]
MAGASAGIFSTAEAVELRADPIEPSWVIEGRPQARSGCHSTNTDGWAATYVWDCTAGRFNWHYAWEETVLILDGEVHVTDAAGQTTVMRPGTIGYFPSGSHWVWHVPAYVRKLSFNRREVPKLARAVSRLLRLFGRRA